MMCWNIIVPALSRLITQRREPEIFIPDSTQVDIKPVIPILLCPSLFFFQEHLNVKYFILQITNNGTAKAKGPAVSSLQTMVSAPAIHHFVSYGFHCWISRTFFMGSFPWWCYFHRLCGQPLSTYFKNTYFFLLRLPYFFLLFSLAHSHFVIIAMQLMISLC